MPISERAASFQESVIREMTRLHAIHGGVNLAQGYPDFDPPAEIVEAACRALREGFNQYAITWGTPRLREAIARHATEFNRIPTDPAANVTVCCGATETMIATLMAVCNPGDEVIVFAPYYENYGPDAILSGAKPVYVRLRHPVLERVQGSGGQSGRWTVASGQPGRPTGPSVHRPLTTDHRNVSNSNSSRVQGPGAGGQGPDSGQWSVAGGQNSSSQAYPTSGGSPQSWGAGGAEIATPSPPHPSTPPPRHSATPPSGWSFDPEELEAAFSKRTRAVIVNTPHNPTGHVFSRAELEQIAELCCRHDCLAITDEIYEHILYDGREHVSLASLDGMQERTITISGASKTFSVTGWRIGWAIAPPAISTGIRRVHDFLTVGAPHPLQEAAVAALGLPEQYYRELAAKYADRRDRVTGMLEAVGLIPLVPEGAYYTLAETSHFGFPDDVSLTMHMIRQIGVAVVPGSSFYPAGWDEGKRLIRFAFPKRDETLDEAARRLAALRPIGG